jgi:hypothetical protein
MASASLNKRCKDALELAGVDVSVYSSHTIRGNVECVMIQASHESSRFEGGEAIKRSRHSWGTFEKNYRCPADALYLEELRKQKHKADFTPEEAIRVGGEAAARLLFSRLNA